VGETGGNDTVCLTGSGKGSIAVTLNGCSEGKFSANVPLIVFGQGAENVISESGLTNPTYLIENPTTDNIGSDLDHEAIQWAGLAAAIEILGA
jgi:hypothetical protein